jgi:hypothetical protein
MTRGKAILLALMFTASFVAASTMDYNSKVSMVRSR